MTKESPSSSDKAQMSNEIVWTLQRTLLLFRYWSMPVSSPASSSGTSEEAVSVRAFALLLIVTLTFAIRGDADVKVSFTALVGALAALLSFGLSVLSRSARVDVREAVLISAYASIVLVMVGFLFSRSVFTGVNWYEAFLAHSFGHIVASVIVSVLLVYTILFLKALFWDKSKVSPRAAAEGLAITVGSGVIVGVIAYLNSESFNSFLKYVCGFSSC